MVNFLKKALPIFLLNTPCFSLLAFAKPFEAPTSDQILKVKSHTYVGEGHPVEKKVVLNVKVSDLKLSATEKHKFLLLSGPRYNVNTEELVMSSERFPHRKQNKKYLLDVLNKLIAEAKVISTGGSPHPRHSIDFLFSKQDSKDTFADIPLDLPKPKQRLEFPKEWIRSPVKDSVIETQVIDDLLDAVAKKEEKTV